MLNLFANTKTSDNDGVWDLKCWSAIALFGLLLSLSNTHRFLQQAGKSVALLAGGAVVATLIHKEDDAKLDQLALELQAEQEEQLARLQAMGESQQQLIDELYESAITESTLFTNTAQSNATSQAKLEQSKARIAELETALAEKTTLATDMLTELEAEATSTFKQFNNKIAAQDELINNLHRQIESLRATNAELTARQTNNLFASIGTEPLLKQQQLSQLLKN